ncbi:hypothetical protein IQ235_00810 [Oscillatoriales cyanobacterium LEGE 11467]|uniref:Uncharacterized protein n=1 Tax=Zarconia navalis LEGE 11467 TaxID=1828826 RepID=A0A928VWZ6_9CYAN|nr:hypothetical protein [Zarconia navalis]MBE9039335.1 hypothetical protein [Zarconia navalis LEGE 11467]
MPTSKLIPIHQYHTVHQDGWRFFFSTNSTLGLGWIYDKIAFFAFEKPQPGMIPVHQYHTSHSYGWRFFLSTNPNVGAGWIHDKVAFFSWETQQSGAIPVYQYHTVGPYGWRFFLTTNSDFGAGWIYDKVAFYAHQYDLKNWMALSPKIHAKPLKQICIPTSHDTATYKLGDRLTIPPTPDTKAILELLDRIELQLARIRAIQSVMNPATWLKNEALPVIKDLSAATHKSIKEQLEEGIRGFDWRIYYNRDEKEYYSYHGLEGIQMTEILGELREFLNSTQGEIVYITMGHYQGFDRDRYPEFANLVKTALQDYVYRREIDADGTIQNHPFDRTYQQIITQDGSSKSRVILVNATSDDLVFWPIQYSPPDSGPENEVLYGYYTHTTDKDEMLKMQRYQLDIAREKGLPFALYVTLTPSFSDVLDRIVLSLTSALDRFADSLMSNPSKIPIAIALKAVVAGLKIAENKFPWFSLKDLSDIANEDLIPLIFDRFVDSSADRNEISLLYLDFYETTEAVSLAISLSNEEPFHVR